MNNMEAVVVVTSFFESGAYSAAEAARLIGVPGPQLRRWVSGYEWKTETGESRSSAPLWGIDYKTAASGVYLSFRDLMEARIVKALARSGVSLQTIRRAIVTAKDIFSVDHPLSTDRFRTDGREVFFRIESDGGDEPQLINLRSRQHVFHQIVAPSFKHIEFDDQGEPLRWWPMSSRRSVVVDPGRSFGRPIDHNSGVPTSILVAAIGSEGSIDSAARAFETTRESVRHAQEFERLLAA